MPTRLIAVLTQGMDSTKPDSTQVEGAGMEGQDEVKHDTVEQPEGGSKSDEKLTESDNQPTVRANGIDTTVTTNCDVIDMETETSDTVDRANSVDEEENQSESCDNDESASGETGPHVPVVANTVIVSDTNSVAYRNHESLKEDDTESDVHVNAQTVPTVRTESNSSPVSGGLDTKRNRSSGKSSKKDKPSPFRKKDSLTTKEILNPNSPTPVSTERCDSSLSTNSGDLCRICQCDKCEIQLDSPLVSPCLCSGSLKFIHQACLQKWIKSSDKLSCELCQYEYSMTKKTKPFKEWERLDMTPAERRKVICSVTFHIIAITCVVWSLYVLIDRTTEEVEAGTLLWPFWTKLIVVAIGFTGGVVFMYVQCKMYLTLCKKWRMYNKVIIISSISESQREKANQQSLQRLSEKQAQLEDDRPNLNVFNIVNETESV